MAKRQEFEVKYQPVALDELLQAGAFVAARIYKVVTIELTRAALSPSGKQRHELTEPIPTVLRERIDELCPGAAGWEQRVGDWRVIYAVEEQVVYIVGVGLKGRRTLEEAFRLR
jgi:hypothetical protein